jgi:integrase
VASISTDPKGNRTIQFVGTDKKRRSIRVGKTPMKATQAIATKVESIISHQITRQPLEAEVARWIASLNDVMTDKLVKVGLIDKKRPAESATVGDFLDGYLKRRADEVKSGTFVFYGHTVRNLKTVFGEAKPLSEIHPGDADDFRRHLQQVEKLSPATVVRRCTLARTFFKDAVRRRLITANPFDGVGKGSTANPDRQRFIDRETIGKVIEACPNGEWRLLVALSRFGGLRVPSEPLLLRWQDVDTVNWERMLVHSPKTEHHPGKATRTVPIFPELRPHFMEAFELAEDGAEFVLPSLRKPGITTGDWRNVNFGTMFAKIIKRAGFEPWPRAWHNLRSSRQTELTDLFPSHVVTGWLGNSERIADKHYNQVLESHFQKAVQIQVQQNPASTRTASQTEQTGKRKTPENHVSTVKSGVYSMGDEGFESLSNAQQENEILDFGGAESGAVSGFSRLVEIWDCLEEIDRGRLLELAEEVASVPR